MAQQDILERVKGTMRRHGMPAESEGMVLGVSGGPDSLALLHLMAELCDRGFSDVAALHVGHLHHGIRGADADADVGFVEAECARLDLPCSVRRVDVPRMAREQGMGEEAAGRAARYGFLTELAQSVGATRIALGHHADDQAETVVMRLMRGAGLRGMGGIPYTREAEGASDILIVRPLLDCTRVELEAYLRRKNIRARLDVTNLSSRYLRNRVRARLLPALEQAWGRTLRQDLCALAAAAQRLHAQAARLSHQLLGAGSARIEKGYVELDAAWLRGISRSLRYEFVRAVLERAGLWRRMLSSRHYDRLSALVEAENGAVSLPGEIVAVASHGRVIFHSAGDDSLETGFRSMLVVPGVTPIPPIRGVVSAEILENRPDLLAGKRRRDDPCEALLDMDRLAFPLTVRFRRPGDHMRPLGATGERKLQDIFTDLKLPRWRRGRIPVVTMHGRPIWVAGYRIAEEVKLGKGTRRVLRLRFRRDEAVANGGAG